MVEINGTPCIKLSQDVMKVTMPGKKTAYRLYGADGKSCQISLKIEIEVLTAEFFYLLVCLIHLGLFSNASTTDSYVASISCDDQMENDMKS